MHGLMLDGKSHVIITGTDRSVPRNNNTLVKCKTEYKRRLGKSLFEKSLKTLKSRHPPSYPKPYRIALPRKLCKTFAFFVAVGRPNFIPINQYTTHSSETQGQTNTFNLLVCPKCWPNNTVSTQHHIRLNTF